MLRAHANQLRARGRHSNARHERSNSAAQSTRRGRRQRHFARLWRPQESRNQNDPLLGSSSADPAAGWLIHSHATAGCSVQPAPPEGHRRSRQMEWWRRKMEISPREFCIKPATGRRPLLRHQATGFGPVARLTKPAARGRPRKRSICLIGVASAGGRMQIHSFRACRRPRDKSSKNSDHCRPPFLETSSRPWPAQFWPAGR